MDALQKKLKELREVGERGKGHLSVSREWYMNVIEALEEAVGALEYYESREYASARFSDCHFQYSAEESLEKIAKKLGVGGE